MDAQVICTDHQLLVHMQWIETSDAADHQTVVHILLIIKLELIHKHSSTLAHMH